VLYDITTVISFVICESDVQNKKTQACIVLNFSKHLKKNIIFLNELKIVHDFTLLPQCKWDLRSSRMLRSVDW